MIRMMRRMGFCLVFSLTLIGVSPATSSAAGAFDVFIFYPNLSDPTNGTFQVYNSGSNPVATYRSGSGSSYAPHSNPCNKYHGAGDWNGGGRLPGTPYGTPWVNVGPVNWYAGSLYRFVFLNSQIATANRYGNFFDCKGPGYVWRTDLGIHSNSPWAGNYVTFGCIKLSQADWDNMIAWYAFGWGANLNTTYPNRLYVAG